MSDERVAYEPPDVAPGQWVNAAFWDLGYLAPCLDALVRKYGSDLDLATLSVSVFDDPGAAYNLHVRRKDAS
jgi:hypothetical protein